MNTTAIVPSLDPIPVPAPLGLIKVLLWLTLLLHLVAMNWMLGGALIGLFQLPKAAKPQGENAKRLSRDLAAMLPTLVAATVTLGVAPLLFVQTLYGTVVYTASIASAWFWWLIIPMLIAAYYLLYRLKFQLLEHESGSLAARWVAVLLLVWISFVFSNVFNLSQQPERFTSMLTGDTRGWHLNLADPSTFPRWLHMVLGAAAIAGLGLMWFGRVNLRKEADYGQYCLKVGFGWFAVATLINILVGFVLMMTLRRDVMLTLMGGDLVGTVLWLGGLAAAIAGMAILKKASTGESHAALTLGSAHLAVTMAAMVVLRDRIRDAYLKPHFDPFQMASLPQWGAVAMFVVALVAGLLTFRWLVRSYYGSAAKPEGESGAG